MADRTPKGQFAPGHKGGPGRPKKAIEDKYLKVTQRNVSVEDWAAIVQRAVTEAMKGDAQARKWLADYIMGRPVERLEHSGPDGSDIPVAWTDHTVDYRKGLNGETEGGE